MNTLEVLDNLINLMDSYSKVYRYSAQPYAIEVLKKHFPGLQYDSKSLIFRETLIEHVGSLPIVATFLYPHIGLELDLGRSLIMLALHDIGETVHDDKITFLKNSNEEDLEFQTALSLLEPQMRPYLIELEKLETNEAKFAKAVDKLTPDLLDLITPPEITIKRLKEQANTEAAEIPALIVKYKRPFMLWNKFLTEFHIELIDRLEKKLSLA